MKRFVSFLISAVLLFSCCIVAFAYKSNPDLSVTLTGDSIPEGTVYVDVLMPKSAFYDSFVEFNENAVIESAYRFISGVSQEPYKEFELLRDDEIVQYTIESYYSFIAHYDNAQTEYSTTQFNTFHDYYYGGDSEYDCTAQFYIKQPEQDLSRYCTLVIFSKAKKIKLAYVGETGNILLVTEPFSVRDKFFGLKSVNSVSVNGEKVKVNYYTSPFLAALYLLAAVVIIVVAVIIIKKVRREKQNAEPETQEDKE